MLVMFENFATCSKILMMFGDALFIDQSSLLNKLLRSMLIGAHNRNVKYKFDDVLYGDALNDDVLSCRRTSKSHTLDVSIAGYSIFFNKG